MSTVVNELVPNQKRYRDWQNPVGSKDSMEVPAIINGIGPKFGFNMFKSLGHGDGSIFEISMGHSNNTLPMQDTQYRYLTDKDLLRKDLGGAVVTPDGILTLVEDAITLSCPYTGTTQFTMASGAKRIELLLIASHQYVEESGNINNTVFRLVPNTTVTSLRDNLQGNTKRMLDWLTATWVFSHVNKDTDVIVGLYSWDITNDVVEYLLPYNYQWPQPKLVTDYVYNDIIDKINAIYLLPRTTRLELQSKTIPDKKRWLDKTPMVIGDTLEVYSTNLAPAWNEVRDVMSIWEDLNNLIVKPKVQVIFNNTHYPLSLSVIKLTDSKWVAEYFKGADNPKLFRYLVSNYIPGDVLKVNVIENTLYSDGTVVDIAGASNTITLHTKLYLKDDELGPATNTLEIWATSSSPVESAITCHVTGVYNTETTNGVALDFNLTIPIHTSLSDTHTLTSLHDVDYIPDAFTTTLATLTPSSDVTYSYVINPANDNSMVGREHNLVTVTANKSSVIGTEYDLVVGLDIQHQVNSSSSIGVVVTGSYILSAGGPEQPIDTIITPTNSFSVTQIKDPLSLILGAMSPQSDAYYHYDLNPSIQYSE